MAKGLSLAQLAEAVGIGPNSVSLIAAMEHGTIPPRRDVAERLAAVLDLDREPLLMWADTRMTPRASDDALRERQQVETLFTQMDMDMLPRSARELPGDAGPFARVTVPRALRNSLTTDAAALSARIAAADASDQSSNQIPVLPAGADPDRYRRKPLGYLDRVTIERLIGGRAKLVRPVAYQLSDDDFERLRRVANPHGRPLHALVSRARPIEVDPREPYAIRFDGRVILAYCAWDGRELVVLQPPGQAGFARLKARNQSDLEQRIIGQVVTLNWWEPTDTPST